MPDTATYTDVALIPGETAEQRARRIAARQAVRQRMARVQLAMLRLQALGLSVKGIDASSDRPILTIAPSWRCGALGAAWTVQTTATHATRQADVHGCRVRWEETHTAPGLRAI